MPKRNWNKRAAQKDIERRARPQEMYYAKPSGKTFVSSFVAPVYPDFVTRLVAEAPCTQEAAQLVLELIRLDLAKYKMGDGFVVFGESLLLANMPLDVKIVGLWVQKDGRPAYRPHAPKLGWVRDNWKRRLGAATP